jgi:hypothetical protein
MIIPAYDDIILALAENQEIIKAKVVTSPLITCQITRSKRETYRVLKDAVRVPVTYADVEEVTEYPVFVKPDRGQGSQGAKLVRSRRELEVLFEACDKEMLLISEYLPGLEYTVDCFSDRRSGLKYCAGRTRTRTRNGISMDSVPVQDERFMVVAQRINSLLELHGAWFFQLKEAANGELALLEVAPRIAGTMALNRVNGVNFPLLSIYEQQGLDVGILTNDFPIQIDRALTNRYFHELQYSTVYVDLDDTLLLKGGVNVAVVAFLYQSINEGKKIVLVTRHANDLAVTLAQHRLTNLFDDVFHLREEEPKSRYITSKDAIFIDDSFRERKEVARVCGIPTFDCSMLEVLTNHRI